MPACHHLHHRSTVLEKTTTPHRSILPEVHTHRLFLRSPHHHLRSTTPTYCPLTRYRVVLYILPCHTFCHATHLPAPVPGFHTPFHTHFIFWFFFTPAHTPPRFTCVLSALIPLRINFSHFLPATPALGSIHILHCIHTLFYYQLNSGFSSGPIRSVYHHGFVLLPTLPHRFVFHILLYTPTTTYLLGR